MLFDLFNIVIFPGFLFLAAAGFAAEFIDRKLYARLQNRVGPPWFQPWADFIKLSSNLFFGFFIKMLFTNGVANC